jgi:NAD(P)-dependent dehydrogenase (short-subunit alcohol dehydrogenase family)
MGETMLVVGARGLGRDLALHFGRLGWQVIVAARTPGDVERVAREVDGAGGRGVPLPCDLVDPRTLQPLVAQKIDLAVAAQAPGGRFGAKPLVEIDREELTRGFEVTLLGTWNLLHAIGPAMLAAGRGTFIQMGTSSGVRTKEGFAALGTLQAGLRALVQVAAREWRLHGVHVAYIPIDGPIESDRVRGYLAGHLDRALPPSEIAGACEYLHRQDPRAWTHELLLRPQRSDWTTPT